MGEKFLAQNRSVLILVQTMTKSTSNLCEGARSDWRDALAQCPGRRGTDREAASTRVGV